MIGDDEFFEPKPWLDLFRTNFSQLLQDSNACVNSAEAVDGEQCGKAESNDELKSQSPCTNLLSLPSEVLFTLFSLLEAEQLSALAQVSTHLLPYAYDPRHWRRIAVRTWPHEPRIQLERSLHTYKTWRQLCVHRPHIRTNAIFVVRHQFAKTSTRFASEEPQPPVFLMTYYRFLRFYTDGTVVSLTSPEPPHLAVKRVRKGWMPAGHERENIYPSVGKYEFDEFGLAVSLTLPMRHPRFPHMRSGTIYMRLVLSGTKRGAFDRLFLQDHYAIMDDNGNDLVPYRADSFGGKPFRLIPVWGFRSSVYKEFPRDDDRDLAQWFEMKKASKAFKKQTSNNASRVAV